MAYLHGQGSLLYFGDAEAHLNIARRIVDSRSPGFNQLGTVWLPLPHLAMLPFAANDTLWRSGLAGAIPSAAAFVAAAMFLFGAARRLFASLAAAFCALAILVLNPNALYLQAAPMTEAYFLAAMLGMLFFTVSFGQEPRWRYVAGAGLMGMAGSMTRYEAWFLLPFAAVYCFIAAKRNRAGVLLLFSAVAGLGPLWWFAYNWWLFDNPLEFYNGPYSPTAIQGGKYYPGHGDWLLAAKYFFTDARLVIGSALLWLSALGLVALAKRKAIWPMVFLALTPAFYLWSMHSTAAPIFVPELWPHSYYNTRYGLCVLPLAAFLAAGLVAATPGRARSAIACLAVAIAVIPWLLHPSPENWICWKDAQATSRDRMLWTHEGARYMKSHFRPGDGVLTEFSDITGIFREAGIPLRDTLTVATEPDFEATYQRPDLFLRERWAVAMRGDTVETIVERAGRAGLHYALVKSISSEDGKEIRIYHRE